MTVSDPDSPLKPGTTEQSKEDTESCRSPALERLWVFSCELSRGRSVSSMAWNKNNPVRDKAVAVNLNHCHFVFFECDGMFPSLLSALKDASAFVRCFII